MRGRYREREATRQSRDRLITGLGSGLSLIVFGSAVCCAAAGAQTRPAPTLNRQDLEHFADSAFKDYVEGPTAPSLAVIVVRGDSALFQKGYGFENESRKAVSPESTIFNIASVSKLFVMTAVMQLADAGRVQLDDPVAKYLDGVKVPPGVTVRQLLTHMSGLDAPFMRDVVARPDQMVSLDTFFARNPPRAGRQPGREIRYSNHGMALAALIVERVSGEPFDAYVERHIFAPLGMQSSTFLQPAPPALAGRVATAGAGRVPNLLLPYPAGSMISTVGDIGLFMRAHLNGGRSQDVRILSEESAKAAQSRQWSANPRVPGVGLGFFESDIGGQRGLFHTGARTHFSLLYLLPDHEVGIFVVHSMRQGGPFQQMRTDFVRAFVKRYFPADSIPTMALSSGREQRSQRLAGVYRPMLLSTTTIERAVQLAADTRVLANEDGSLDVSIPAGRTLRVVEQYPGVYRATDGVGGELAIGFSDTMGTASTRMSLSGSTQDPVSFDRLEWYEQGKLHAIILGAAYFILATFFIVSLIMRAMGRLGGRAKMEYSADARRAWRLAVVASAFLFAAPVCGALLMIFGQGDAAAAEGVRRAMTAALALALIGSVVAVGTIPFSIIAWRRKYWSVPRRLYYVTTAVAAAVLVPLLAYYHLLGFWL